MFIAIEGVDGSGKTTLARALGEKLGAMVTSEPYVGRSILLKERLEVDLIPMISPVEAAYIYSTLRHYHVRTVIRPALQRGEIVISDRYVPSTWAYQTVEQLTPDELRAIQEVCQWGCNGIFPDITFLIDIPPELAVRRQRERVGARFIGLAMIRSIRNQYLDQATNGAWNTEWVVLDGTQPVETLVQTALERIQSPTE